MPSALVAACCDAGHQRAWLRHSDGCLSTPLRGPGVPNIPVPLVVCLSLLT